jgi:hypothetical protein
MLPCSARTHLCHASLCLLQLAQRCLGLAQPVPRLRLLRLLLGHLHQALLHDSVSNTKMSMKATHMLALVAVRHGPTGIMYLLDRCILLSVAARPGRCQSAGAVIISHWGPHLEGIISCLLPPV